MAFDDDAWGGISPATITGFGGTQPGGGSGGLVSGVQNAAITRESVNAPLYSPDNPLFWLFGLLALGFGFVYVSTEVKAGPFKAKASA